MENTYTKKERNMYLMGMLGQNIIYCIISTGMTYYFQSVIFIPAIAISAIMSIARIWDAVNDPLMGTFVDKTRTRWGKCRPYLLFVPLFVAVSTILTFINGRYSSDNSQTANIFIIIWAGVSYILWGMVFTAGDIPLWGITSLMTEREKDRSSLLGYARIFAGIGNTLVLFTIIPISQSIANMIAENGTPQDRALQSGFIIVAVVLTIIGCLLFECAAYAKERVSQPSDEHKSFFDNVSIMWNCKPFRRILISGVIRSPMLILSIVSMTLLSYYFGDNGGNGQSYAKYLFMLAGGMFIGQSIAMAVAPKLCEKFEKRKVYNACCIISAIPFASIYVCYAIDGNNLMANSWYPVLFLIFAVAGAGIGASQVIQSIMIADCVDYDEYHTGYRPDGVFFSGQSFITKLGSGISSIIQGIVFAIVGFSGDNVARCNELLAQSSRTDFLFATAPEFEPYRFGMFFLVSIPPAIGFLLSVIPMKNYEITNEEQTNILNSLNEKRNQK